VQTSERKGKERPAFFPPRRTRKRGRTRRRKKNARPALARERTRKKDWNFPRSCSSIFSRQRGRRTLLPLPCPHNVEEERKKRSMMRLRLFAVREEKKLENAINPRTVCQAQEMAQPSRSSEEEKKRTESLVIGEKGSGISGRALSPPRRARAKGIPLPFSRGRERKTGKDRVYHHEHRRKKRDRN